VSLSSDLRADLKLDQTDFAFLSNELTKIRNVDDAQEFKITCQCMESVDISVPVQHQIFRLLAGILHLGNIKFQPDDDEGQVGGFDSSSESNLSAAADLLGLEVRTFILIHIYVYVLVLRNIHMQVDDLGAAITKQNMFVGGSVIVKRQSQSQVYSYCFC
jgi:myosin heavy subunit